MKRAYLYIFLLFIILLLSSCASGQDWRDNGSEESLAGAECGEYSEEVLNHDGISETYGKPITSTSSSTTTKTHCSHIWTIATCQKPEMCILCGETQGKNNSLAHSYGPWKITGDTIYRACPDCGLRDEGGTLDRDHYSDVQSNLIGYWYYKEGDNLLYSLNFHEDKTFSGVLEGKISGTWELVGVHDYPFANYYRGCINLCYTQNEQLCNISIGLQISPSDNYPEIYVKNQLLYKEIEEDLDQEVISSTQKLINTLSGQWTSVSTGVEDQEQRTFYDYSFNFSPEGTFCAELSVELTGYWDFYQFHPDDKIICKTSESEFSDILLSLIEDDFLALYYTDTHGNNHTSLFRKKEDASRSEAEEQIQRVERAQEYPAGNWTSIDMLEWHTMFEWCVTRSSSTMYTMNFAEDGSFVGTLYPWFQENPLECRWELSEIDSTEEDIVYKYLLITDDASGSAYIILFQAERMYVISPSFGGPQTIVSYKRTGSN